MCRNCRSHTNGCCWSWCKNCCPTHIHYDGCQGTQPVPPCAPHCPSHHRLAGRETLPIQ